MNRRRNRSSGAAANPSLVSQPPDPRFAVPQSGYDLVYMSPPPAAANAMIPFGTAPSGTMKIRQDNTQICPGFVPPPTCLRLEYNIPAGTQQGHHPHPGVSYPSTKRYAYLPNDDSGCKLLARFKVAWNYGYMFKIGISLTSGLDDQVCWTTIPNKTSVNGGPFGFPDSNYIAKANAELDKLGIPSADQCLLVLNNAFHVVAAPSSSSIRPPAQNPSFVANPSSALGGVAVPSGSAFAPPAAFNPVNPMTWGFGLAQAVAPPAVVPPTLAPQPLPPVTNECIPYKAPKTLAIAITPDLFDSVTGDDDCAICLEKVSKGRAVKIKGCKHEFHVACLQDSLKHNPRCPTCRKPLDCARGKSPSGKMTIDVTNEDCPGFGAGVKSIRITYNIPGDKQMEYHENPGKRFSGTTRTAYLPNNAEGQKLLRRLKYAWTHGLTFRVGRSLTSGLSNQVTWTSIHHKTSLWGGAHGFPDASYLDNVNGSLDALHVPSDPSP